MIFLHITNPPPSLCNQDIYYCSVFAVFDALTRAFALLISPIFPLKLAAQAQKKVFFLKTIFIHSY